MLHRSNQWRDVTKQSSLHCLVFCVLLNITTRPLEFGQGAATAAANKHDKDPATTKWAGLGSPGGRAPGRGTQQREEHRMKKLLASASALAALFALAPIGAAQADELTLCWAAW